MGEGNGNGGKLIEALNSGLVILLTRVVIPVTIAIAGGFGSYILHNLDQSINRVETRQETMWTALGKVADTLATDTSAQAVLTTEQHDMSRTLADHEGRIRSLERPVH